MGAGISMGFTEAASDDGKLTGRVLPPIVDAVGDRARCVALTVDMDPTQIITLVEVVRPPSQNDIGMVAWRITMCTPQYGEESGGREVVLSYVSAGNYVGEMALVLDAPRPISSIRWLT